MFEQFEQLADTADSISKLRGLLLELAVRGLLSERLSTDSDESDWSALVWRLDEQKAKSAPRFQEPFSIPNSWRWVSLEDLGSTKVRNNSEDGLLVSFVPMALIPSAYGVRAQSEIRPWSEVKKAFTHFADGDVVLAKITPCFENGKSTVMRGLSNGIGAGTTELHVFRPSSNLVLPEFVLVYIKTNGFIERGIPYMTGSAGQKRVPREYLSQSPFPLPPPAEQKRIVAKVDELMALCDQLEAQQQERETRHAALARASLARFAEAPSPANLSFLFHPLYAISPDELRQSILALAVQGRLVPQCSGDEPAKALLARIACQKQAKIKSKEIRQGKVSRPHTAADAPAHLPVGWEWVTVDSLCFKVTDGTHFTPQYAASGVRFVSAKDIVGGKLSFDQCKYIALDEHRKLFRRCNPEYHDIVISKSGSIGTVALVEDRDEFSLFESLALLKFDQKSVCPSFFVLALTNACASLTAGHIRGVGVKHLHLDILRGLELPLPPLAEQRRIVAKVDQLMALVDQLEAQLHASRATATKLLDTIVAELTAA
ncbi:MAG: restriction endonuclease subunit S [Gammaproteobacteria bacterium]